MRILLLVAVHSIAGIAAVRADDATLAELTRAKDDHAKKLARLRDKLLVDIDEVIKREADAGAGVTYLLKEKKGFEVNGVLPVLPKLLPASRACVDGKRAADAELEKVYAATIADLARSGEVEQVAKLRDELKALRAAGQLPDPLDKTATKDEKIEKDVARAKSEYATAIRAASADLVVAIEDARTKVAASKTTTNDEKLKQLELLANEKRAFEASVALPKSPALRTGRQQFDEAARKAQQAFVKAMDAAATAYLERKDVANSQIVLEVKRRLLAYPNSINLLELVDVSKDAVAGGWELKMGILSLVSPVEISIIQIPYEPGPEYNLHLAVERVEGRQYFSVGLVASANQCTAMLDGWPDSGHKSGIQLIDDKYLIDNGTAATGQQLPLHKVVRIDVAVRKDSIIVWVKSPDDSDSRRIVSYTGRQDRLSAEKDWLSGIRNKKALFLHAHTSKFTISSLVFEPVGREAGKRAR